MKKSNASGIRLGIFVSIGSVLFILVLYYIGQREWLFTPTIHISGIFTDVSGLQVGNNVRFSGINVGKVDNISIISDTWVRVDMSIDQSAQKFIRKDAKAIISSEGLMGSKVVKIIAGQQSLKEIDNDGLIETLTPPSIDDVVSKILSTAENSSNITADLAVLTEKIKSGKGIIGRLMMDSVYSSDLGQSLTNMKKGTSDLAFITNEIKSGKSVVGKLLMDSVYGADIGKILSNMKRSTDTLMMITNNINTGITSGMGVINKLLMDSVYANNIGATLVNARQTSQEIKEIMPAVKNNFLFRGYFRKEKAAKDKAAKEKAQPENH